MMRQGIRRALHSVGIVNPTGKLSFVKRRGLTYAPIFGYEGIPGWLSEDEAITLFDTARALPNERPVIVEIGSWLGKSSLVLAKGLKGKKDPLLHCIDPFNADGDSYSSEVYSGQAAKLNQSLKDRFIDNMRSHGVLDRIEVMEGYSFDFADTFNKEIDFLFIDGNHDLEVVMKDYELWSPLIKVGGLIAFHDVVSDPNEEPPGPRIVVESRIMNNPSWVDVKQVDSLLIARKSKVNIKEH